MKRISLYSDVLSTKGFNRSLLFDTTRSEYYFISNDVLDIFKENKFKNIDSKSIASEFYEILVDNDLVYETDERTDNCFIPINKEWDFSFKITNCIIELSNENIDSLIKNLNFNFVAHFHILFSHEIEISTIDKLFHFLENQICDCIEFSFTINLDPIILKHLKIKVSNLSKIVKYLNYADLDFEEEYEIAFRHGIILDSWSLKLSKSADHFFESQNHHTYFNRKLFLSKAGEIKNAIEYDESFGNLSEINNIEEFIDIINLSNFQKYWFIEKNTTDVCKDCEFKNICVDNRLPIQRDDNQWYHFKECIYNPYIAKWKDDEGYQTLEQCGVISNEKGFSIDYEKIVKINALLWDEEEVEAE